MLRFRIALYLHKIRAWLLPVCVDAYVERIYSAPIEGRPFKLVAPTDPEGIQKLNNELSGKPDPPPVGSLYFGEDAESLIRACQQAGLADEWHRWTVKTLGEPDRSFRIWVPRPSTPPETPSPR